MGKELMIFLSKNKFYALNIVLILFLSACSSQTALMPSPNVYTQNQYSEDKVPVSLRKPNMELLYVTDRGPSLKNKEKYSSKRSASMSYGVANVGFRDKSIKWNKLLVQSNQKQRSAELI